MIHASAVLLWSMRARPTLEVGKTRIEPHVALARRSDDSKVYPGFWECPCGKVEKQETGYQTVNRELEEETGVVALETEFDPVGRIVTRGGGPLNAVVDLFMLEIAEGVPLKRTEPTKRGEWRWWPLWKFKSEYPSTLGHDSSPLTVATKILIEIALLNHKLVPGALP